MKKLNWARHQHRWFGKWHLYLGLFAGCIVALVGLTGSILVFQDEIDRALNPEIFKISSIDKPIPLQDMVVLVQKKYPEKTFNQASIAHNDILDSTYRFRDLKTRKEFFVNPYTAEISGSRDIHSSFIRIVMDIHMTLLIPVVGKYIVGFSALCLLIITISGLRLWLPTNIKKWKQWKDALRVNFNGNFKRQNLDWHNVLGFYSSPIIIVLSLTGFIIAFSSVFIAMIFMLNGQSPNVLKKIFDSKSNYNKEFVQMPVNKIANDILLKNKNAHIESIMLPKDERGTYMFMLNKKGRAETGNSIMMSADQYSGQIIMNSETDFPPLAKSYLNWTIPLHYGTFGGLFSRILVFIAGLIPLAMLITGFIIWLPRLKKCKKLDDKKLMKDNSHCRKIIEVSKENIGLIDYFKYFLGKGLRYAVYFLGISLAVGFLYGLIGGKVVSPLIFLIAYAGIIVILNFLIALITLLFQCIFLLPFKKGSRIIYKYVAYSLGFLLVFLPVIIFFANFDFNLF